MPSGARMLIFCTLSAARPKWIRRAPFVPLSSFETLMAAPPLSPFVFRLGRVGDTVMLTALLRQLHARYGAKCHVVGAGAWHPQVLQGVPDVERCYTLPRHLPFAFTATWLRVVSALRRTAPGPVYVCEYDGRALEKSRRLLSVSGIDPRRILQLDVDPLRGETHWIDIMRRFGERTPAALSAADYPSPPGPWAPSLTVTPGERAHCEAWLAARGWGGEPIVLLQPGNQRTMSRRRGRIRQANADDKAWPIERWGELIRRMHERLPRALLLLLGAGPEVPMLEEIRRAAKVADVAVASLPLRPTFALCAVAHSMISVDTGPAHAAAAVGLPLVVLFGVQPPAIWTPRSSTGAPVVALGGPPVARRVDEIPVEAVLRAWSQLLERRAPVPDADVPAEPAAPLTGTAQ
jgi:heptosyltransferase-2/heptosyltransferase-3